MGVLVTGMCTMVIGKVQSDCRSICQVPVSASQVVDGGLLDEENKMAYDGKAVKKRKLNIVRRPIK